jgi:hypothetical protein
MKYQLLSLLPYTGLLVSAATLVDRQSDTAAAAAVASCVCRGISNLRPPHY